jgi:DNA repair photolyase
VRPIIQEIECKSILTPARGFLTGYTHTLNPYAGCAFGGGCGVYCYVAEMPVGRFGPGPWGTWVRAKVNAPEVLRRELARLRSDVRLSVFMSSATDPYQPAEARYRITRRILEVFAEQPIGRLVVQTRSPLVERDLELLARLPIAWLSMTVETDDDRVRQALTPICPSIQRRLLTMRRARDRGITVQAAVSPVLPHDPNRFITLLEECADRVVVDSFVAGDGAGGSRTAQRPLAHRFRELGWGNWRDETAARELYQRLVDRLGPERVGWSEEGFRWLAARET